MFGFLGWVVGCFFFFFKSFSSNIEELGIADGWLGYGAGLYVARNSLGSFASLQKHCMGNMQTTTAVRQLI